MKGIKAIFSVVKQAGLQWKTDNAPRFAASVTFFTIFSIAPLLTIVVAVAGAVFGDSAAREALLDQIHNFTGSSGAQAVETILTHAQFTTGGILTTAFQGLLPSGGLHRVEFVQFAVPKRPITWSISLRSSVSLSSSASARAFNWDRCCSRISAARCSMPLVMALISWSMMRAVCSL